MDTLLFTYLTNYQDPHPMLVEENNHLKQLFAPRAKEGHFLLHSESFISSKRLSDALALYRNELVLLHFSGFAVRDHLFSTDAISAELLQLLSKCPNLKLVFLNGCATKGQVQALLKAGIPMVIGTNSVVSNPMAIAFSQFFYEAMAQQFSIWVSFSKARGAMATRYSNVPAIDIHSSLESITGDDATPQWGLFYNLKYEHLVDWTLPIASYKARTEPAAPIPDFIPNQQLIETLISVLGAFEGPKELIEREQRGETITIARKRMQVLNALVYPLAEPLRRLVAPVEQEKGLNQIGEIRLRQWHQTYFSWMRFFISIQLSQLGDYLEQEQSSNALIPEIKEPLEHYLTKKDKTDLFSIAQALHYTLDNLDLAPWYVSLGALFDDPEAKDACFFLELIPEFLKREIEFSRQKQLCIQAEECFTLLVSRLSFASGACTLASVKDIQVEKRRGEVVFSHDTVMLDNLLGGFDLSRVLLHNTLIQRSILLINTEDWTYLNLSPLLVDETAFFESSDIVRIFQFNYLRENGTLMYDDFREKSLPYLEIVNHSNLASVYESFESFYQAVFEKPLKP